MVRQLQAPRQPHWLIDTSDPQAVESTLGEVVATCRASLPAVTARGGSRS
jgi:hypothetical protein